MAIRLSKEKVQQRATITGDFLNVAYHVINARYKDLKSRYDKNPVQSIRDDLAFTAKYLVEKEDSLRTGKEYLKMMLLKQSGITAYGTYTHKGEVVLRAKTIPIIAKDLNRGTLFDCGSYEIFIFLKTLEKGGTDVHLIPQRAPTTRYRHFHHGLDRRSHFEHPLDGVTSTCINTFGQLATRLCRVGDVPQIFGSWYIFLTRYNSSSPLIHLHDMPFIKRVS